MSTVSLRAVSRRVCKFISFRSTSESKSYFSMIVGIEVEVEVKIQSMYICNLRTCILAIDSASRKVSHSAAR